MDAQIFVDLARYAHIVAVAVGFGTAFLTDMFAVRRLAQPINRGFIASMQAYHRTIWFSVIAMWITGLVMVYIRTGFDPSNFTPKLVTKLTTVTILTLNAQYISAKVLPLIEIHRGQSLMSLPLKAKLRLSIVGALSTSSWMLALAMGSSKVLAASGVITFVVCVPIVYFGAIAVAVSAMYLLHLGAQMAQVHTTSPVHSLMALHRSAPLVLASEAV